MSMTDCFKGIRTMSDVCTLQRMSRLALLVRILVFCLLWLVDCRMELQMKMKTKMVWPMTS